MFSPQQRLKGSCPFLFTWNGERFVFVTDFMWGTPLGLYINAQSRGGFLQSREWVKVRGDQLVPRDGHYEVRAQANLWETHYFDHLALHVIDHPPDTEMFVDESAPQTNADVYVGPHAHAHVYAHDWYAAGVDNRAGGDPGGANPAFTEDGPSVTGVTPGLILSVLVVPMKGAPQSDFRKVIEDIIALVERSPDAGRPVPPGGPEIRWPPQGLDYEARARRGGSLLRRRVRVLANTLVAYAVFRLNIRLRNFVPRNYVQEVVENSDFRKYDDGLRMILDCTGDLAQALEQRLAAAASAGIVRYGLHRQDAAMMTCFTPSLDRRDHVHFIDGARGGYATAATALKAMPG